MNDIKIASIFSALVLATIIGVFLGENTHKAHPHIQVSERIH